MTSCASSLLRCALKLKARLFAQFGGQGAAYLTELRNIYLESSQLEGDCKTIITTTALIEKADEILREQSASLEAR